MDIRQDMIVAIRRADGSGQVRVANVEGRYPVCVYPADPDKEIDIKNHKWALFYVWVSYNFQLVPQKPGYR
uniref:Pco060326 n=1 Tax=Arundo donax TaxID=35708 RepID=A0A0A9DEI3_ARUDO